MENLKPKSLEDIASRINILTPDNVNAEVEGNFIYLDLPSQDKKQMLDRGTSQLVMLMAHHGNKRGLDYALDTIDETFDNH